MYYVKQQVTGFTASNITEAYPVYNPATTYTFEASSPTSASVARFGSWYYRSLVNNNLGNNPETTENIKWIKYGPANSHAMLDLSAQSRTTKTAGNLSVTFTLPSGADALGLGLYEADTVLIELLDASNNVVWTYTTLSTYSENIYDWYTWTFAPKIHETDRSFAIRIPIYIADKCRVTFNAYTVGGNTSCGFLLCGSAEEMGTTLSGVNIGFNSYSVRNVDDFGGISITKRAAQDLIDFETILDRAIMMRKKRAIKADYNEIMMFVVDDTDQSVFENLVTLGLIQEATPIADEFDKVVFTWSIIEAI